MLKFGIIGFGGIARSHKSAYEALMKEEFGVKLVSICDIRPEQFGKDMEINLGAANVGSMDGINLYTSVDDMLETEELDGVDICLPTYLHADMAVKCLDRGLHVMCEKPMALTVRDCDRMIDAAEKNGKKLMIGLCLRFDPAHLKLKRIIDSNEYGEVKNAYFDRLSGMPSGWENWYADEKRCGGIEFDLHVHDLDMARFLFGEPEWVSSVKNGYRNINTRLGFENMSVMAVGDWSGSRTFPFTPRFRVAFETATVEFNGGKMTVYPDSGAPFEPQYEKRNCMTEEIRYFLEQIINGTENTVNPLASARTDVELITKITDSWRNNGKVIML